MRTSDTFQSSLVSVSLLPRLVGRRLDHVKRRSISRMLERQSGFMGCGMMAGEISASAALRRMIHGYQVSQALYVAATLGIADLLIGGPLRVEELAEATSTHASSLHRMPRLLASQEVFAED